MTTPVQNKPINTLPVSDASPAPLNSAAIKTILKNHYAQNPSLCNKILCNDCTEPSCFITDGPICCVDCMDTCCCLMTPRSNVVLLHPVCGPSRNDYNWMKDCGIDSKDCGAAALIIIGLAAVVGLCACGYSCCKGCNQMSIINKAAPPVSKMN